MQILKGLYKVKTLKKITSGSQFFPLLENNPSSIKILLIILNSSTLISEQLSNDVKLFDLFKMMLNLMKTDEKTISATSNILKKCNLALTGVNIALKHVFYIKMKVLLRPLRIWIEKYGFI